MLLTDTNVLLRVARGRGTLRVKRLIERGVQLATTDANVLELRRTLATAIGLENDIAEMLVEETIASFEVLFAGVYQHLHSAADVRLGEGGKADWPLLAAALALDGEIWSDDRDFFGVGVPVWSTPNVHLVPAT